MRKNVFAEDIAVTRVAYTTVDHDALATTGYISHYYNPYDPEPDDDWIVPSEDSPGLYEFDENSEYHKWLTSRPKEIDELHEACGRICYESWHRPNPATRTNRTYLGLSIIDNDHGSVLEHGSVTVHFKGLSRWWLAEIERHRLASYSIRSTRYCDESEAPWTYPEEFKLLSDIDRYELEAEIDYVGAMGQLAYRRITQKMTDLGFTTKETRGAARYGLISCTTTEGFMTANIRHWRHIIEMRNHPQADSEIREFARQVLIILRETCPNSVQDLDHLEV